MKKIKVNKDKSDKEIEVNCELCQDGKAQQWECPCCGRIIVEVNNEKNNTKRKDKRFN